MKNYTKSKIKYGVIFFLHNLLLYISLGILLGIAFCKAEQATKMIMSIGLIIEIIIVFIALITKKHFKSIIWILMCIIYASVQGSQAFTYLAIIAIYTFLDEIIFEFLYSKWQKEYRDLTALKLHEEDKNE